MKPWEITSPTHKMISIICNEDHLKRNEVQIAQQLFRNIY